MIGRTISHYEILEKLGEGGMGVVYKARDTKLDRIVAIKFLPPHMSSDPDAVKRFVHEAKTASALNHSAIGVIHEIDETDDGQTFIVMALYEGGTLREKIDGGSMTTDEAVAIASQIASGLARAHEKGIVHRDIKPQNILLTRDGEVKIIDFGLAKLAGRTKLTRDGSTLGTAAYMSPEQARGEEVDHRSDIFSIGTILYEMLAGETPFKGEHEAAMLYGIVHEEPVAVSGRCKGLPAELCDVIEKALKKDKDERYQTAAEMKGDLKMLQVLSAGGTGIRTSSRSDGRSLLKNLWVGIAAVAVIVVVIGYLMKTGREPAPLTASEMSLAVLDFRDMSTSADPMTSVMLTEMLNTALIESCPIRVQSPERVRECRRQLYGSADAKIKEGQELEIANESEATYVLTGSIGILDDERIINWRLIEVTSGDGVNAGTAESGKMSVMVDDIVGDVLKELADLSGYEKPAEPVPVNQITTSSSAAYEHYIRGRLMHQQHLAKDSMEELEHAVALDSCFALAYLELARLYFGSSAIIPNIVLARK
jgi:tRNA A-37 threonylcarbamoyl transferase component Bud32/TolB-like protein